MRPQLRTNKHFAKLLTTMTTTTMIMAKRILIAYIPRSESMLCPCLTIHAQGCVALFNRRTTRCLLDEVLGLCSDTTRFTSRVEFTTAPGKTFPLAAAFELQAFWGSRKVKFVSIFLLGAVACWYVQFSLISLSTLHIDPSSLLYFTSLIHF